LKQFLIYLVAYFLIQEAFGAASNIQGILQNSSVLSVCSVHPPLTIIRVIKYNTIELSGLTALDFFTGATGTLFVSVIQQRYKLKSKTALLYGAGMTILLEVWGAIGSFTHVIGFHHGMLRHASPPQSVRPDERISLGILVRQRLEFPSRRMELVLRHLALGDRPAAENVSLLRPPQHRRQDLWFLRSVPLFPCRSSLAF